MIKIFTKNSNFLSNIEFYEYFHFKDLKIEFLIYYVNSLIVSEKIFFFQRKNFFFL
jgi:hypothetical protein